jgi:acyl-CoA reductase-like NAD-dependent aldehyde dehydrogenase
MGYRSFANKATLVLDPGTYVLLNDGFGGVSLIGPFQNEDEAQNYGENWEKEYGLTSWVIVNDPTFTHTKLLK